MDTKNFLGLVATVCSINPLKWTVKVFYLINFFYIKPVNLSRIWLFSRFFLIFFFLWVPDFLDPTVLRGTSFKYVLVRIREYNPDYKVKEKTSSNLLFFLLRVSFAVKYFN